MARVKGGEEEKENWVGGGVVGCWVRVIRLGRGDYPADVGETEREESLPRGGEGGGVFFKSA